jgi:hypothetical protein
MSPVGHSIEAASDALRALGEVLHAEQLAAPPG